MMGSALTEWLFENGGPTIRYRTATELLDDAGSVDRDRLARDLLESAPVRLWLDRLAPGDLHGSRPTAFENAINKLAELGVSAGMAPLDERVIPFRSWLATQAEGRTDFFQVLVASGLLRAGYGDDEPARSLTGRRLDDLHKVARRGTYDIFVEPGTYPDVPKAFLGRPIVKPEFAPDGVFQLPALHDAYALAHLSTGSPDDGAAKKIERLIRYILHPTYQAPLPYGILRMGRGRYAANGWAVELPGYNGFHFAGREAQYFIQRVELMAHFPSACRHRWFRDCMRHLEGYRTERGTYLFPRTWLKELSAGYWVSGAYMGLEENRRASCAIEIESTFRMLRIKRLAER